MKNLNLSDYLNKENKANKADDSGQLYAMANMLLPLVPKKLKIVLFSALAFIVIGIISTIYWLIILILFIYV